MSVSRFLQTVPYVQRADRLAGVTMNEPSAAADNAAAINAFLQTLRIAWNGQAQTAGFVPIFKTQLQIPNGSLWISDEIVVPNKTNLSITGVGSGISYRNGDNNYGANRPGGPESKIICTEDMVAKPAFRLQGYGTEIAHLKIQGRSIPENDSSGVGDPALYGVLVEGHDTAIDPTYPPTGKHHLHDLTFIEVRNCVYCSTLPESHHADSMCYGKMVCQGVNRLLLTDENQSISHHFYADVEIVGLLDSDPLTVFEIQRGGHLKVANLLQYQYGTTLKLGESGASSEEFSFNTNNFDIYGRFDTPASSGAWTLLDATLAPDSPYKVRFGGQWAGTAVTNYTTADLFKLNAGSSANQRLDIRCDFNNNFPAGLRANFPSGPPVRVTTSQRTTDIAYPYKGLVVYDTDLNALYHYDGSAWAAV